MSKRFIRKWSTKRAKLVEKPVELSLNIALRHILAMLLSLHDFKNNFNEIINKA